MATLSLTWKDFNLNEDGFNIYRSETPMDVNNMPAPIATVGPNVGSYDDTTGVNGTTYYYRVGAVRGSEEKISPELERVFDVNSWEKHDVFGDGSAVATYKFDGDATDLGGTYNGTWSGTESYVAGKVGQAASFSIGTDSVITSSATVNTNEASVSFWFKMTANNGTLRSISEIAYGSGNFTIGQTGNNIGIIPIANGASSITIMASLTVDSWYNIYADTNGVLYLNNSPTTNIASTAFHCDPVNGVRIGRRTKTAGSDSIGGEIDQFRIFNRALTQQEVDILYQEGAQFL